MKRLSKILSVVLSLALCAGLVAPSFAASFTDLQSVIDEKQSLYKKDDEGNDTEEVRIGYQDGTVTLHEEVKYTNGDPKTITIRDGTNVTLDLNGNNIDGQNKSDSVITINKGGTLTLTDSTAYEKNEDGTFVLDENGDKVRKVDADGNAVAGNGAITGGTGYMYGFGGGVYNSGTFNMESGTIEGNTVNYGGGGVCNYGTFTMTGGAIEGNEARSYGGGVWSSGTFTMEGGSIAGNRAKAGGGINNGTTTFTMTGGTIAGNYAEFGGGVCNSGPFAMEGGTIKGNYATLGGGVSSDGTFTMTGGTIEDNTAKNSGGGVRTWNVFTMEGGTIKGNTADTGGGVAGSQTFTMTDKGTLAGNTANTAGDEICAEGDTRAEFSLPEGLLWDRDNGSDRENGVEKVYGAEDLKSISHTGLKHHEHKPTVSETTKEPTCTEAGEVVHTGCICGQPVTEPIDALGHEMGEWEVITPAQVGVAGEETRVCARGDAVETRPIDPLPLPVPAPAPVTDPTTEIDDVDVPLAGLFTRADAIGYLWEKTGSPEWELSDFADVPEDHEWAVAIGWAEDMGIAVADADGNFRPDDLVLRSVESLEISPEGELQEFLNRYAAYAGVELDGDELFVELEGAADDVIMGEEAQEIFDSFFAKLETAPAQAA